MRISIFRTPKPRHFEYNPLYYDEREDRRERSRRVSKDLRNEEDTIDLDQVREDIRYRWSRGRRARKSEIMGSRYSSLIIALIVLLLLAYFIFFVPIF